jgi:hypothetical protein
MQKDQIALYEISNNKKKTKWKDQKAPGHMFYLFFILRVK